MKVKEKLSIRFFKVLSLVVAHDRVAVLVLAEEIEQSALIIINQIVFKIKLLKVQN